jgi:hypothetical protein
MNFPNALYSVFVGMVAGGIFLYFVIIFESKNLTANKTNKKTPVKSKNKSLNN